MMIPALAQTAQCSQRRGQPPTPIHAACAMRCSMQPVRAQATSRSTQLRLPQQTQLREHHPAQQQHPDDTVEYHHHRTHQRQQLFAGQSGHSCRRWFQQRLPCLHRQLIGYQRHHLWPHHLQRNSTGNAGGIVNGYGSGLTVINSTISGNTASSGTGGIFNDYNATLTVSGSTISGNSGSMAALSTSPAGQ